MTLPIFPGPELLPGLAYSSKWSPRFFNRLVTTATGAAIGAAVAQYPLHDFELTFRFLRDGPRWGDGPAGMELRTLMGFFLQAAGTQGRFLYRNPADWQVFRTPIGTGDGATTVFTLSRWFGANGYGASEPVGQADTAGGLNVYLAGSAIPENPAGYAISTAVPGRNTITFESAPESGAAIEADLRYWYYCRLDEDQSTFEKFMSQIWTVDRITLHSCRAGA